MSHAPLRTGDEKSIFIKAAFFGVLSFVALILIFNVSISLKISIKKSFAKNNRANH